MIYLTGTHNAAVLAAARRRRDIGLLITPLTPQYLRHAAGYPVIAIDNGAFSKTTPFSAENFRTLIGKVAARPELKSKVRFVVAPDVPMDAAATLERFGAWADEIHDLGLPVAFAAQDGIEMMSDRIPWDKIDVLFIGGSTEWKTGKHLLEPTEQAMRWLQMTYEAKRRGILIHVGRVNSSARVLQSDLLHGATTADGTFLAFGPDKNLPRLEKWLDDHNSPEYDDPAQLTLFAA